MLGKLFGSNTRVKILKLFLSQPENKFYIRQISRDLRLQLNSVRRELDNLEQFGLLISNPTIVDARAKEEDEYLDFNKAAKIKKVDKPKKQLKKSVSKLEKKYYQINTNFVIYEEIKSLVVKAQVLYERDFIKKLAKAGQTRLLILTGFFVNQPNKLADLLIVGRFNKNKLHKLIKDLEDELGREVNYALMNTSEFKYRRDITDVFLYDILENKKIVIIDEFGLS
jgi:hypothetical protein